MHGILQGRGSLRIQGRGGSEGGEEGRVSGCEGDRLHAPARGRVEQAHLPELQGKGQRGAALWEGFAASRVSRTSAFMWAAATSSTQAGL